MMKTISLFLFIPAIVSAQNQGSGIAAVGFVPDADVVVSRGGSECIDLDPGCSARGSLGECDTNPELMLQMCPQTCDSCLPREPSDCIDKGDPNNCFLGAQLGQCVDNPSYYLRFCADSCREFLQVCKEAKEISDLDPARCTSEKESLRTNTGCGVQITSNRRKRSPRTQNRGSKFRKPIKRRKKKEKESRQEELPCVDGLPCVTDPPPPVNPNPCESTQPSECTEEVIVTGEVIVPEEPDEQLPSWVPYIVPPLICAIICPSIIASVVPPANTIPELPPLPPNFPPPSSIPVQQPVQPLPPQPVPPSIPTIPLPLVPPIPPPINPLVPNCLADGYLSLVQQLKNELSSNAGRPISASVFDIVDAVNFCQNGRFGSVPSLAVNILSGTFARPSPPQWSGLSTPSSPSRVKRFANIFELFNDRISTNKRRNSNIQLMQRPNPRKINPFPYNEQTIRKHKNPISRSFDKLDVYFDQSRHYPKGQEHYSGYNKNTYEENPSSHFRVIYSKPSDVYPPLYPFVNVQNPYATQNKVKNSYNQQNNQNVPHSTDLNVPSSPAPELLNINNEIDDQKLPLLEIVPDSFDGIYFDGSASQSITSISRPQEVTTPSTGVILTTPSQDILTDGASTPGIETTSATNPINDSTVEIDIDDSGNTDNSNLGVENTILNDINDNDIETGIDEINEVDAQPTLVTDANRKNFHCGGVLITRRHILTAAHCVLQGKKPNIIRLGEVDFSTPEESQSYDYRIARIDTHSRYKFPEQYHDMAILTLEEEVRSDSGIDPFCLPTTREDLEGRQCTVSGWGTRPNQGASEMLINVPVVVNSLPSCNQSYSELGEIFTSSYPEGITDFLLCASSVDGNGICRGDSGGPLALNEDGFEKTIGVVSSAYGCGSSRFPGLYSRVDAYLDWIERKIVGTC